MCQLIQDLRKEGTQARFCRHCATESWQQQQEIKDLWHIWSICLSIYLSALLIIGLKCIENRPPMYRESASNVCMFSDWLRQITWKNKLDLCLKCTDRPQMYRESASNVQRICLKCIENLPQMYRILISEPIFRPVHLEANFKFPWIMLTFDSNSTPLKIIAGEEGRFSSGSKKHVSGEYFQMRAILEDSLNSHKKMYYQTQRLIFLAATFQSIWICYWDYEA